MEETQQTKLYAGEPEKHKREKWFVGILKCFLFLLALFAIQIFVSIIMMVIGIVGYAIKNGGDVLQADIQYANSLTLDGEMTVMLTVVTFVTTLGSVLWYYLAVVKKTSSEKKNSTKPKVWSAKNIFLCVLAGFACYGIAVIVSGFLGILFPEAMEDFSDMMDISLGGNMFLIILTTVIVAPIGEEAMFRGLIYHKLLQTTPFAVALLLQAVFFGVFHGNLIQGIYVLPLALCMGYFVYRWNSIIPSIIIHAVNNGLSVFLGFLPVSEQIQSILFIVVILLSAMSIFILFRCYFKEKIS